ncbi:MAG: PmoA family protein [Planctomyces sp.]|nr:PmoA family protein [Planctomyces sp.]
MDSRLLTGLAGAALLCLAARGGAADRLSATVQIPDGFTPNSAIVRARLPIDWNGPLEVTELPGGRVSASQFDPIARTVHWRLERPRAGETRTFEIVLPAGTDPEAEAEVGPPVAECRVTDDAATLVLSNRPVLRYNTAAVEPPTGLDPVFRRSGHIHPFWTPGGRVVTDEFPADHPHQHGVFSAWVHTSFEGRPVDFWNQGQKTGTVEHRQLDDAASGPLFAGFVARLEQIARIDGGDVPALRETWRVRTWNLEGEDAFVVDVDVEQQGIEGRPLTVHEYHYGGFAVRGAAEWFQQPGSDFLTSEGRTRRDGNHTRPAWVALHGTVDGAPSGIALICHPGSVRAPQPIRLHPDKPYFVYSPPVLGEFQLTADSAYRARYRLVAFDGPPDADRLNRLARDFAEPLTATLSAD